MTTRAYTPTEYLHTGTVLLPPAFTRTTLNSQRPPATSSVQGAVPSITLAKVYRGVAVAVIVLGELATLFRDSAVVARTVTAVFILGVTPTPQSRGRVDTGATRTAVHTRRVVPKGASDSSGSRDMTECGTRLKANGDGAPTRRTSRESTGTTRPDSYSDGTTRREPIMKISRAL